MADYADREHYIPIRKSELIDFLCEDKGPTGNNPLSLDDQQRFRQLASTMSVYYTNVYHMELERLKADYAPFDPDADTKTLQPLSEEQREAKQKEFLARFEAIMQRGNYKKLTRQEFFQLCEQVSEWGVNMDVDFDAFDYCEIYVRGSTIGTRMKSFKYQFWKKPVPVRIPVFLRVVIIFKQRQHKRLDKDADTRSIFIKMFKDIPQMDIEMLIPGARLKMPVADRYKLGGSILSSIAYVIYSLAAKFTAIVQAIAGIVALSFNAIVTLLSPLALILGYGYKQWAGFQQTKQAYAFRLTKSLYYQSLDSNQGVIIRILDDAIEQECREAYLAYFYLWRYAGHEGWTARNLDDYIELELERRAKLDVDFEIGDALDKLTRLGVLIQNGERYRVVPIEQAQQILERACIEELMTKPQLITT